MASAEPTRTWESTEAAEMWRQSAPRRAEFLGAATDRMLEAAGIEPGMRVLDIAAGTGDSSLIAARKVGPHGSVLATDISQRMLNVAADLAREAGLINLETLVGDATRLELPDDNFDAAICRFGLMFMPDLEAVLTRVRRTLKPGARFATLVWSTDAQNPWITVQLVVVREMDRIPSRPPTLAQTTSLSAPGRLEQALRSVEFQQ